MYTLPMPFDWLEPRVGQVVRRREAARTLEAHRRDVRDRAAILMRLGWSAADARERCRRALEWEHDLAPAPAVLSELDTLIAGVYERR